MKYMVNVILALLLACSQAVLALPEGSVNVNTAQAQVLAEVLDGIGSAKAQAIIEYREQYGEFTSVEELLDVRGIGPRVLEANREKIALSD
jgi:competence protein ComEA